MAWQGTYDVYGAVASAEELQVHPRLHAGHKGLFLDRLDVGVVSDGGGGGGGSYVELPRLVPFGHSLCYNRNRTYAPGLGRFLQMDPNASAMALIEAAAYHGRGAAAIAAAFDIESMYGDGYNLYEYLSSAPWSRYDPMGLAQDPFDMVDEYIAEWTGSIAGFINQLIGAARAAAFVGAMVLSMAPFPVAAIAGEIGMQILEGEVPPELQMAAKVMGYATMGAMIGMVAKIGYSAIKSAIHYVSRYGILGTIRNAWNGLKSLTARAKRWIDGGCGCFAAGTPVWTIEGSLAIEEVVEGATALVSSPSSASEDWGRVSSTSYRRYAPIIALAVVSSAGHEVLSTTNEHLIYTEDSGWMPVRSLMPGDHVRTLHMDDCIVESILHTGKLATVYNLEIEGAHAYHVGASGVLVHNGSLPCFRDFTRGNFKYNLKLVREQPGEAYEAHHIIPHRFQRLFPDRNLNNPLENGAWVHKDLHRGGEGSLTSMWEEWARKQSNITAEMVLKKSDEIFAQWGLFMLRP